MINKLTKEQEKLLPVIRDKWINLAYTPKEINREQAIKDYEWLYKLCGINHKPIVVFLDSPMALQIGANIVCSKNDLTKVFLQVDSQVYSQVRSPVQSQVRSPVQSQVRSQVQWHVRSQVRSQVYLPVRSQVESQVYLPVQSQVHSQVGSQVQSPVQSQVYSQVRSHEMRYFECIESQITSESWVCYYDFFEKIGVVESEIFTRYRNMLENGIWMSILLDKFVFVCPPPIEAHRLQDGRYHNDQGMCLKWADGWGIYSLNGVSVPGWLVNTHSDKLKINDVMALKNADQRAEGIRKIGIERLKSKGKVIDSYKRYDDEWYIKSKYELIDMSPIFKSLPYAPYLSMANQTVPGVWHMEAVPKDCRTVRDAVNFRIQNKNAKIISIK